MLLYLFFFSLGFHFHLAVGFIITVDAHEKICFYNRANTNDKISIIFEVLEGGFLDLAVHITDPAKEIVYTTERDTMGKYTFAAARNGSYSLCFDNEHSTLTPKVLMFTYTVVRSLSYYANARMRVDDVMEQAQVQANVNELSSKFSEIRLMQEYMHVRYKHHLEIGRNTHMRVVIWSFFTPSLMLMMTLVEIYYLKRFFEVKRVV